jgi:hypothetical protein
LAGKTIERPLFFRTESLLREARRQENLPLLSVPPICLLDPDGDIVRWIKPVARDILIRAGLATTPSYSPFRSMGRERLGFIGCAVGAPFAVLVAEQIFCLRVARYSSVSRPPAGWQPVGARRTTLTIGFRYSSLDEIQGVFPVLPLDTLPSGTIVQYDKGR